MGMKKKIRLLNPILGILSSDLAIDFGRGIDPLDLEGFGALLTEKEVRTDNKHEKNGQGYGQRIFMCHVLLLWTPLR